MNDTTLILNKPVQHGNETITELVFREPTAKEFMALMPETLKVGNENPEIEINLKKVMGIIPALTNQPPTVIDKLSVSDYREALDRTMGFFQ